jgi:hypothetical protein
MARSVAAHFRLNPLPLNGGPGGRDGRCQRSGFAYAHPPADAYGWDLGRLATSPRCPLPFHALRVTVLDCPLCRPELIHENGRGHPVAQSLQVIPPLSRTLCENPPGVGWPWDGQPTFLRFGDGRIPAEPSRYVGHLDLLIHETFENPRLIIGQWDRRWR